MTMAPPANPDPLAVADTIAGALASPDKVVPALSRDEVRHAPTSLAGGATGIALLHVERARSGRGDWETAHAWLAEASRDSISASANACLFYGAPALTFVLNIAASGTDGYQRARAAADRATNRITRAGIAAARSRIDRGASAELCEFDLVRGLAGLAAYHLGAHADHPVTRDTLGCLARLTEPLPGTKDSLPPWWTNASPSGELSPDYPEGHGNFGMSHGISAVLAVLSMGILRGISVPGTEDAVHRICHWMDQWRQGDHGSSWWPGFITRAQATARCVDPSLRPRPSWCYGVTGMARAQQLAGFALREPARQHAAENAMLGVLRNSEEIDRLTEPGLCHGIAGLLQVAWRMAGDATGSKICSELPHIAARLSAQLAGRQPASDPELLDGTAGAALALNAFGTGSAPEPCWDAFLAIA